MKTALVLGSGGFIASHMVKRLKSEGYWVRGVDLKYPEFSPSEADEFIIGDLTGPNFTSTIMFAPNQKTIGEDGFDEVYQFAADMGGAGYVFSGEHDADIMRNSALINLNVASWATACGVGKLFYSSSACMYPANIQETTDNPGLKESDAYPANPDSEYGWEKLFSERLYLAYARNYGLNIRIARFHNIYGPEGTYKGGKEKAPAAMCRKVIESPNALIEVWGDGKQTRSFLYITDCIDAVRLLMQSEFKEPINIGSEEMISISDLAWATLALRDSRHLLPAINYVAGPTGVRGRNSNNDLIVKELGWFPKVGLTEGMARTFEWIMKQYEKMG